jgi:hypothetical protein
LKFSPLFLFWGDKVSEREGKEHEIRKLHQQVIAVAVRGGGEDWAVYIGPCLGIDSSEEWKRVYEVDGMKVKDAELAHALFPRWDIKKYRR